MLCEAVKSYLANAKGMPFFYAVGDENYNQILSELKQNSVIVDRISDFCPKDDKFPDIDDVIDYFRTLDTDYRQNKHVLIGLGEYLALRGSAFAEKILRRLDKTTLGTARVVLLLRCVTQQVNALQMDDNRIVEQNRLYIEENAVSSVTVTCTSYFSQKDVAIGVKKLLHDLEDGLFCNIHAISALDFSQSLVPVSYIKTPFVAIQHVAPGVELTDSMGTTAQWEQFYQELLKCNGSLDKLFSRYDCADDFEEDIYEKCAGLEFKNWVFYISLKQNYDRIQNDYLAYVVANTDCYEDLRINLLTGIVHIPRSDRRFHNLYTERKKLVKGFPESEIAAFIRENQIDPMESIYRYTDNTKMEREAIISWVAQHGYIAEIEIIYPALAQYLGEYVFDCGGLSDELTKYFKQYRLMKVTNQITPEFLAQVEQNAQRLPYTHLETRDSAILRIPDKKDAFLYWIDALGVEYLSYIAILAKKKGLSIHVDIAYVELPTITSINKGFFEKWAGSKKEKEPRLDEIKHKEEGGYFYKPGQAPVHLASELEVIRKAVDRAATELAMHTCKTFVIASDHGASRLAVIHHQEEKYDTDTKGEHSGRCCKEFADADLPQAICENGYLVLADYGRFKNSRAANVEVHGGASLEEVIVPIITLSLKKQCDLIIKLINADAVYCDRRLGTTIQLYISDADNTQSISVVIDEKRYAAKGSDKTHYEVNLYDMRRAKKNISAAVYDGDDLIGTVHFDIKGKMATVSNDFDDLF
ncbi:MAG: BREX-4 system phosphatase PglZ [Bacillota bacterium]|nr:BREX-4 system phosphatase PglZ [Bacillota bacterium]